MTDRPRSAIPARRIAFFISPHGFGHAARAAGVMEALTAIAPSMQYDVFTTVPDWFFGLCNSFAFNYHYLQTDIGLVQKNPFQADLAATVRELEAFLPFDPQQIAKLADHLKKCNCEMVVCDIAPMGVSVAKKSGIPSVLIENFTWDWLYQGYNDEGLNQYNTYFKALFADATYHIQTRPVCKSGSSDLLTAPVSRKIQKSTRDIRQALGLSVHDKVVMITAGGVPKKYGFLDRLKLEPEIQFVLPGAANSESRQGNLILLPENSGYFHPDLINTADAVVGKTGYSTIAEIYQAGAPFGYVARPDSRESKSLVDFVIRHMRGMAIVETDFHNGAFADHLAKILKMPRTREKRPNGADQIANFILDKLNR
jgi:UDP-N-acetylglucosamine:LPS N-acetylglucosamine transferase